jgi:hypothetical protein
MLKGGEKFPHSSVWYLKTQNSMINSLFSSLKLIVPDGSKKGKTPFRNSCSIRIAIRIDKKNSGKIKIASRIDCNNSGNIRMPHRG